MSTPDPDQVRPPLGSSSFGSWMISLAVVSVMACVGFGMLLLTGGVLRILASLAVAVSGAAAIGKAADDSPSRRASGSAT
jgi:hypothetical protein